MKFKHSLKLFQISLLIASPLVAGAQEEPFRGQLIVGREQPARNGVKAGDKFILDATAGSCYCCEIYSKGLGTLHFSAVETGSVGASLNTTNRAKTSPRISSFVGAESARVCFSTARDVVSIMNVELTVGNSLPDATFDDVVVRCDETTLYGGFNTSVNDFNFLELRNLLTSGVGNDGDISGTITAVNSLTGETVINNEPFGVGAGSRTDIDIHSRVGPGVYGSVKVCHDAPKDSLGAIMSSYDVTSTTPLDFALTGQERFVNRESK